MLKARVSSRGQLALPKEVRDQLGLGEGACLTVRVEGDEVILRKAVSGNWREWEGRFKGSDLLGELTRNRRKELTRDRKRSRLVGDDRLAPGRRAGPRQSVRTSGAGFARRDQGQHLADQRRRSLPPDREAPQGCASRAVPCRPRDDADSGAPPRSKIDPGCGSLEEPLP